MPLNIRMPTRSVVALAVMAVFAWELFDWTVNRITVPVGSSLLLQYKGPILLGARNYPEPGKLASFEKGEIGVIDQMPGPGRHFYCPIWWVRKIVADEAVAPGEVAVVTSLVGNDLPQGRAGDVDQLGIGGQFLVDGDMGKTNFKGVLRKVYGPGRYRVNPYAYKFNKIKTEIEKNGSQTKHSGWVRIETGYVGVVTNQTDNPLTGAKGGIQPFVLPPGLYLMSRD